MSRFAKWGFALLLLPLAGCNSNSSMPPPQPATVQQAPVSAQDQNFAVTAGASDLFEIQSAQLALQKSRSPAVRRFAQRMIDDHTRTTQQLAALAQAKGMQMQPALNTDEQNMLAALRTAPARGFDRLYWTDAVTSHQAAVTAFQGEADHGYDGDLKGFAQQTLPTIQQHLTMAQHQVST